MADFGHTDTHSVNVRKCIGIRKGNISRLFRIAFVWCIVLLSGFCPGRFFVGADCNWISAVVCRCRSSGDSGKYKRQHFEIEKAIETVVQ